MTAKERLYNLISDILKKGWEGEALKENEAILAAFMDGLSEKQGEALIETAENRFTRGKVSGLKGEPVTAMAWGIALMISMQGAKWQELKEKGAQFENGNPEDFLAGALLEGVPGDGLEWKWIELFAQQTKGKEAEENIRTTPPKNALVIVDKVSDVLPKVKAENIGEKIQILNKPRKDPGLNNPATFLTIGIDEDTKIKYGGKVSKFDREVNDTICSILKAGNTAFTTAQVCRCLQAKNSNYNPSQSFFDKVEKSIMKQRNIDLTVDIEQEIKMRMGRKKYEEELKARGVDPGETEYTGKMLSVDFGQRIVNGALTPKVYLPKYTREGQIEMPIRYRVALVQNQIKTLPASAFDVPISGTEQNILLTRYLVREMWRIRNNAGSNSMRYDSIYKACTPTEEADPAKPRKEWAASERVEKSRFRTSVKKILEYWADNGEFFEGFKTKIRKVKGKDTKIYPYEEYTEGREIVGVKILLDSKKQPL